MDSPREKTRPGAPALPRHRQSVEFRNVSYRYPGAHAAALEKVNLRIGAGETVAIVGSNGAGKTTLVSMLPRLLSPTEGDVLIDGLDISRFSIRSVRRQIAVMSQESAIFHATVFDNIAYGLRRPARDKVLAAAKDAFVDDFVRQLPEGYDTMLSERGATLSGGQKQRICIARAILRDPAILIFDEAMSQVDSDSERRIRQAMAEFVRGRTTLIVAHRFATVLSAARIVVMDAGRIVDVGPHEELLGRCPLYRTLYQTQLQDAGGAAPTTEPGPPGRDGGE
jgi:subfamily B ATP-binding cassette protein MsbA